MIKFKKSNQSIADLVQSDFSAMDYVDARTKAFVIMKKQAQYMMGLVNQTAELTGGKAIGKKRHELS